MPKQRQEHIAIVDVKIAVFTKDGKELHGPVMNQEEMKEENVPHMFRFQVSGFDRFECLKKIRFMVNKIKEE